MTALNQHVLPTFFSPTGQFSILFLSWGFGESLHTSVCVRFRLALFSAMLASKTLKHKDTKRHFCLVVQGMKEFCTNSACPVINFILTSTVIQNIQQEKKLKAQLKPHLLIACSSSVMPVSLKALFDSSRLRAMARWRSSLSSPVRSITSETTTGTFKSGLLANDGCPNGWPHTYTSCGATNNSNDCIQLKIFNFSGWNMNHW